MSRTVRRGGFTVLEAAVALVIVGMVAVATLSTFAAQARAADQVRRGREIVALAKHRLAYLELLVAEELDVLPDSLARGRFDPPFERYEWTATSRLVRGEQDLVDVEVKVSSPQTSYDLHSRLHRPRRRAVTGS